MAWLLRLDSMIGLDDAPTSPFTPVEVADRTRVLGRSSRYADTGLPENIQAWGREVLAAPARMIVQTAAGLLPWRRCKAPIIKTSPGQAAWESFREAGLLAMTYRAEMEFDG